MILPKPGYSLADLMMEGFSVRNAVIVKKVGGIVIEEHPYTEFNFKRYKPLPPPGYSKKEMLFIGDRGFTLDKYYLGDYLYSGWNPYKQAIVMSVDQRNEMTEDEIIDVIFLDLKWLKRTDRNTDFILKLLNALSRAGYINYVKGLYRRGDRKLPLEDNVIQLKRGVEPVMAEIWEFISMQENKRASYREIYSHMVKDLGWIQTDETLGEAREQLKGYIHVMIMKEYIKYVGQDMFTVYKSLEVIP